MKIQVIADNGEVLEEVTIPDNTLINWEGLKLVGDQKPQWNEPLQHNFVMLKRLNDKLKEAVESLSRSLTKVIDEDRIAAKKAVDDLGDPTVLN